MIPRELIAEKMRWTSIIWSISVINPLMTVPQLIQIWRTHEVAGISLLFLLMLFVVQGGFALHGFFIRDRFVMGNNGLAATMTFITLLSVLYLA